MEKPATERPRGYSSGWPHHFTVLRAAGLVEQRDEGPRRVNRLRRTEFDARFPGLLELVLRTDS